MRASHPLKCRGKSVIKLFIDNDIVRCKNAKQRAPDGVSVRVVVSKNARATCIAIAQSCKCTLNIKLLCLANHKKVVSGKIK